MIRHDMNDISDEEFDKVVNIHKLKQLLKIYLN